ncbi:hypothetical protein GTY77_02060 [Streptomyces sp. SID8380]|nr:hypothetical protein [Streptomyces sp. SID8380]
MMKVRKHPIELDIQRHLVFDLNAIYELEQLYGSFDAFFDASSRMSEQDVFNFLWAGLLHEEEKPELDKQIIEHYNSLELTEKMELKMIILKSFLAAWTGLNKESDDPPIQTESTEKNEWNWTYFVHIGTVLLNMQEAVFWRCTPVKFLALWKEYRRFNGLGQETEQLTKEQQAIIDHYV